MLTKTITGLKNKTDAIEEERRLNALTLAVQLLPSLDISTTVELFELAEAITDFLETGYYEIEPGDEEEVECVEDDSDFPDPMEVHDTDCNN